MKNNNLKGIEAQINLLIFELLGEEKCREDGRRSSSRFRRASSKIKKRSEEETISLFFFINIFSEHTSEQDYQVYIYQNFLTSMLLLMHILCIP